MVSFSDIPIGLDPSSAWETRWIFVADMNRDGLVTVSDLWLWVKWAFYAPGDCILLGVMLQMPQVAKFLEVSTLMLYGWWSFAISLWVWYVIITGTLGAAADALKPKVS